MSSPFGRAAQNSSSPAFNPFAKPLQGQINSFANGVASDSAFNKPPNRNIGDFTQSAGGGQQTAFNPFKLDDNNTVSDGEGNRKAKKPVKAPDGDLSHESGQNLRREEQAKQPGDKNSASSGNGENPFGKAARQRNGRDVMNENGGDAFRTATFGNMHGAPMEPATSHLTDPHAKKVYGQLHRDGISPPQWPSRPGDSQSKAQMASFREKYEAYRDKVRISLTKAGLIDDPEKRKTLRDAIEFRGICEDMCPEYEKITRITEHDVPQPEKDPSTTLASPGRMVKKLARSAAGQEAPLPMDVRSVPALRRTLDYLIDDLLKNDANLPTLHGYLWDRTRAIRRDFTFFSSLSAAELKIQVTVLEDIARFHVTSLHLLSEEGKAPEEFVEQQELEQLGKCLLSLRDLYDDCSDQGIACENEAEFRAYYLVFHANDPNILEILQRQWKSKFWKDSDLIRTAVSLVEALQNTQDFHGPLKAAPSLAASATPASYFRIVEDECVSYTMACFAECHFPQLRRSILRAVKAALTRPKEASKDVSAKDLNKFLRFDTVEGAMQFARLHDLDFAPDEQDPSDIGRQHLVLDNRAPLPHPRLQHQFSQTLVESKRDSRPLPEVIHRTVFGSQTDWKQPEKPSEDGLFVSESVGQVSPTTPSFAAGGVRASFSSFYDDVAASRESSGVHLGKATTPGEAVFAPLSTRSDQTSATAVEIGNAVRLPTPSDSLPTSTASSVFGNAANGASKLSFGSSNAHMTTHPSPLDPTLSKANESKAEEAQPSLLCQGQGHSSRQGKPVSSVPSVSKASPFFLKECFAQPSKDTSPSGALRGSEPAASQPALGGFFAGTTPPRPFGSIVDKPNPASNISNLGKCSSAAAAPIGVAKPSAPATDQSVGQGLRTAAGLGIGQGEVVAQAAGSSVEQQTFLQEAPKINSTPNCQRDLLDDFSKWVVLGDQGLLEEFQVYYVEEMLKRCYDDFVEKREEEARLKEDERTAALAEEFRVYNLSLKFFYRWKRNARQKRLKSLRREGREQARAHHEAQRAAKLEAQRATARRAAERTKPPGADTDRSEQLKHMLKHRKRSHDRAENVLASSGVLSGVSNVHGPAVAMVGGEASTSRSLSSRALHDIAGGERRQVRSPSVSSTAGGSKSRALREEFLGTSVAGFRRSLPPVVPSEGSSPGRGSKVSERWRLKAMGIVQLPDGTAIPESLLGDARYGATTMAYRGPARHGGPRRSASLAYSSRAEQDGAVPGSYPRTSASGSTMGAETTKHKRKRSSGDGGEAAKEGKAPANSHKRVMSDAERLIQELRSMREEMREGASWFRAQSERLQSEMASRGSTPWEES